MKLEARTIDELIKLSGEYEESLRKLDAFMQETAPELERTLFAGKSITMIGYGKVPYTLSSALGVWPIIGVAPQKNGISVYVAAQKEDVELATYYKGKLGKIQYGKKTLRFKSFDLLDQQQLECLVKDAIEWQKHNKNTYGRNCAQPVE